MNVLTRTEIVIIYIHGQRVADRHPPAVSSWKVLSRSRIMSKIHLFHGGPLQTENFDGHSFWTWKLAQAVEYMDSDDDLWVIDLDKSTETFIDAADYEDYSDCESSDENWNEQTRAIRSAVDNGATVVLCDDGWVIVNVDRLSPRRISVEEAEYL
jgi:predicted trehalose synthase